MFTQKKHPCCEVGEHIRKQVSLEEEDHMEEAR